MKSFNIEAHIGARVRRARQACGFSQEKLGVALGVSFQQIQKFESGKNRMSASQLFKVSQATRTDPFFFFDDLPPPAPAAKRGRRWRTDR